MNTFLSSQQQSSLDEYKTFVQENLKTLSEGSESDSARVKEALELLGQKGLLGLSTPKEYGGKGEPFINLILFVEAISEVDAGMGLSIASHVACIELINKFGTDTQKSRYLPLLARGECIAAIAFGEELAGSDLKACTTSFIKEGSGIAVSGKKTWVVNGEICDLMIVSGQSKSSDKEEGVLALWLVDKKEDASIKESENRNKLGLKSARTNDIEFSGLSIEESQLLGYSSMTDLKDSTKFDEMTQYSMDVSKLIVASSAIGLMNSGLSYSVDRARNREQFGTSIGKNQAIQWKLADFSADSSAAKMLTYRAAWSKDEEPKEFRKNSAMSKFYASRVARIHSAEAVQIFGSLGISADEPVEKLYRDAKVMEVFEGTSEIQKNIIAEEIGS